LTRLKSGQDLVTGILFALVGGFGIWIGRDYPMGTPVRLGTGVFPMLLCWGLVGIGAILVVQALLTNGEKLTRWDWRPLIMIGLATIAFSLLIEPAGLVAAMVVSMTLAALGTHETRWLEFAMFSVIMVVVGLGLFIWGLNMPIKVFPWN